MDNLENMNVTVWYHRAVFSTRYCGAVPKISDMPVYMPPVDCQSCLVLPLAMWHILQLQMLYAGAYTAVCQILGV